MRILLPCGVEHAAAIVVRPATTADLPVLAAMCHQLWPDSTADQHAAQLRPILGGQPSGTLPEIVLIAQHGDGRAVGFIQADLRSHADGCNPACPVGYIEGWYVEPEVRRQGVGGRLVAAAEKWARDQGCKEMASDTWIDHLDSQQAHEALGFEVVDRCVHYRKEL